MKFIALLIAVATIVAYALAADSPYGFLVHVTAKTTANGELVETALENLTTHCAYGPPARVNISENKMSQFYAMATTTAQQVDKEECSETWIKLAINNIGSLKKYATDKGWNYSQCTDTTSDVQQILCDEKPCSKALVCSNTIMASTMFAFALVLALIFA